MLVYLLFYKDRFIGDLDLFLDGCSAVILLIDDRTRRMKASLSSFVILDLHIIFYLSEAFISFFRR